MNRIAYSVERIAYSKTRHCEPNEVRRSNLRRLLRALRALAMTGLFFLSAIRYPLNANLAYASLEVDPLRLEIEADSGRPVSGYLVLTNHGDEAMDVSLSPGEYRYMFSDSTVYPENPKDKTLPSCKGWVNFTPDRIKLEKGASQQAKYTIDIPSGLTGEYVAAVLIDQEQKTTPPLPGETGQVNIRITPRISLPLYVAIKNSLSRSCVISQLDAAVSQDKKSVQVDLTLKNTGTVHTRPAISVVIIDEYGAVADKMSLGKSLPMFGGFGERMSVKWIPRFPGKYTLVATVDIQVKPLIQKSVTFEVKK